MGLWDTSVSSPCERRRGDTRDGNRHVFHGDGEVWAFVYDNACFTCFGKIYAAGWLYHLDRCLGFLGVCGQGFERFISVESEVIGSVE